MLNVPIQRQRLTAPARILIVDDHPIVRRGLTQLIRRESDLTICGEAEGLSQALQSFRELQPDLIIADVSLQNGSGIELVKELIAQRPGIRILVCSMHRESLYAQRALRAGAKGYVNKDQATAELVTAIRRVLAGGVYLSERMTDCLIGQTIGNGEACDAVNPIESLSDRELEVFEQIGRGGTTKGIADRLYLSPKTIETYRENIKSKLKLRNGAELTRRAMEWVLESC